MELRGGVGVGRGFILGLDWRCRRWGHLDDIGPESGVLESCRGFCSVPGPLQTVHRAEFFERGSACW